MQGQLSQHHKEGQLIPKLRKTEKQIQLISDMSEWETKCSKLKMHTLKIARHITTQVALITHFN